MGGIMSAPSPVVAPTPQPEPSTEEEPVDLSEEKAREDRLEMIRRRRRGRAGTVHTGWTGTQQSLDAKKSTYLDLTDEEEEEASTSSDDRDATTGSRFKPADQLQTTLGS